MLYPCELLKINMAQIEVKISTMSKAPEVDILEMSLLFINLIYISLTLK